jgi:hypothetical protein
MSKLEMFHVRTHVSRMIVCLGGEQVSTGGSETEPDANLLGGGGAECAAG